MNPALAVESTHIGAYVAVLGFGFLLGTFGHVIRSQSTVLTGILVVAVTSGLFVLVVMKPFG